MRLLFRIGLVISVVLGSLVSAFWLTSNDVAFALTHFRHSAWALPLVVSATIASIGLRFLRWHFLLRANGLLLPTRDSLQIYLAGFAMVFTPGYIGEVVKAILIRWRFGVPLRTTAPIVIAERVLDIAAILIIAALSSGWSISAFWGLVATAATAFAVGTAWALGRAVVLRLAAAVAVPGTPSGYGGLFAAVLPVILRMSAPATLTLSLLASIASWVIASFTLIVILTVDGVLSRPLDAIYAFTYGTAAGAFSLLPAGIGVTGSTMILKLMNANVPVELATASVLITRICSVWFAVGVGVAMLGVLTRRLAWPDRYFDLEHFDEVAPHYAAQIPEHVRDHLLEKKLAPMLDHLGRRAGLIGVDMGCGQGWYAQEYARRTGFRILGSDYSKRQVHEVRRAATVANTDFMVGNTLAMPLGESTVDFAYSINSFHHLGGPANQQIAFAEVARILKPGGCFFLHEMNVNNPVLHFYLSYVFPLVKTIDEGTEEWLHPHRLPHVPGLQRVEVQYFGFMPDFLPRPLMGLVLWLESWLEASPFRQWSAHYMAVYERLPRPEDDQLMSDTNEPRREPAHV